MRSQVLISRHQSLMNVVWTKAPDYVTSGKWNPNKWMALTEEKLSMAWAKLIFTYTAVTLKIYWYKWDHYFIHNGAVCRLQKLRWSGVSRSFVNAAACTFTLLEATASISTTPFSAYMGPFIERGARRSSSCSATIPSNLCGLWSVIVLSVSSSA